MLAPLLSCVIDAPPFLNQIWPGLAMRAISLTLLSIEKPGPGKCAAGLSFPGLPWQACRSEQACLALLVWYMPPFGLFDLGWCLILAGRARNVLVQDFAY